MQRRNRLPHALDETVVVRECAVLFSIRRSRQNDVRCRRSLVFKEFLDHQKIELRECVLVTFKMFRQEAAGDVERTNRVAARVQHSTSGR